MNYKKQKAHILNWYDKEKKSMPWRGENDPYKIWLSEIMLQQTQISTVIDYYNKWIKQFPTLEDVARASQDQILKAWEGLGYYSRARNFHQSCQILAENKDEIPKGVTEFMKLKGVGEYIAAAVQSIAYNIPVPVIDGNVNRVISRMNAYLTPPIKNKKSILEHLHEILHQKRPGDFNQAMMDLGRYICKPRNPLCLQCPISFDCKALSLSKQTKFPIKEKKKPKPHYNVAVGIIWDKKKLLITKRKAEGFLGGLWEFPGGKIKKNEKMESAIKREIKEELSINIKPETIIHQVDHHYSHFSVTINAINCKYNGGSIKLSGPTDFKWIDRSKLRSYAFPKASIKLFNAIKNL